MDASLFIAVACVSLLILSWLPWQNLFVSARKHRTLKNKYEHLLSRSCTLESKYTHLLAQWNTVANQINARGGAGFLQGTPAQLTPEEVKLAIRFCHPDKHRNNPDATRLTQKLLALRS